MTDKDTFLHWKAGICQLKITLLKRCIQTANFLSSNMRTRKSLIICADALRQNGDYYEMR